jgi:RIO kinase 1
MFHDNDDGSQDPLDTIVQTFIERAHILTIGEPIKSGKEASVYRCRAHPRTGVQELALKVYRPREDRSFKNDAIYQEGRILTRIGGGNTRAARALRAKSAFGREVQAATWSGHEAVMLDLLHRSGTPVPRPIDSTKGALLMELFTTEAGFVAPPLHQVRLGALEAGDLFERISSDVERMLSLHVVHGDLSPYNVLYAGPGRYRIIDLPQAVDPRYNPHSLKLLVRDLENVARHCGRFGPITDPTAKIISGSIREVIIRIASSVSRS